MTLSSLGRKGRLLNTLGICGLLLGGCVLATAYGGPAVVLPGGKTVDLKPGEMVVPAATVETWRKLAETGKGRLAGRCSNETGLCTTVVVPLGGSDPGAGPTPGNVCPRGQLAIEDDRGGKRCAWQMLIFSDVR